MGADHTGDPDRHRGLLPMAFVGWPDGPLMSPIPSMPAWGCSSPAGGLHLLPWLAITCSKREGMSPTARPRSDFHRLMTLSDGAGAKRARHKLWLVILLLVAGRPPCRWCQWVVLKMLPSDNKSGIPAGARRAGGATLEQTSAPCWRWVGSSPGCPGEGLPDLRRHRRPINFNGLVRHYFIRSGASVGLIAGQSGGQAHGAGSQQSRDCPVGACALAGHRQCGGGNLKVVEVAPGPPVWSPIVAEVPLARRRPPVKPTRARTGPLRGHGGSGGRGHLSDRPLQPKWRLVVDRAQAALLGSRSRDLVATLNGGAWAIRMPAGCGGQGAKYPVPIRIELAPGDKRDLTILALKVRQPGSQLVRVSGW